MSAAAHILVIEDNDEVRENLEEILELSGFRVTVAEDGLLGARAAQELLPDLILCDVMMPRLDGFGVLDLLGGREETAGIPFVFITARTETEDIRRGMQLGADDYITKPFYKDELLNVIRTRLRKAELRSSGTISGRGGGLSNPERGRQLLAALFEEAGERREVADGESIFREGERPYFVYRVEEGAVHLIQQHAYGRDFIIAAVGEGEVFGLPAALERLPQHYTARAATATLRCRLLPIDRLLKLISAEPHVAEYLLHRMARRLRHYGNRLVGQAYDSVRRRTASVLVDLLLPGASPTVELSREQLAQLVGTTKESAIRTLSDFKKEKLITVDGNLITVLDEAALRAPD